MLAQRIIDTLRFFDLQQLPLTAFEVYQYLIADKTSLKTKLNEKFDLVSFGTSTNKLNATPEIATHSVNFDTVLTQLHILSRDGRLETHKGYYCLPGKKDLINQRLVNYLNGIKREKLIARFLIPARHIPFVRGIALAGSQALGQQRTGSDIDLLIITDEKYMWTARTILSFWFQIFGVRRHGKKIANRFCLNHYLAGTKERNSERNLYTALEYSKLRAVVYEQVIEDYQLGNQKWIKQFFPNIMFEKNKKTLAPAPSNTQSGVQKFFEKIFTNSFGKMLEQWLGRIQLRRIHQDQFVFVREDELSFHPDSKQQSLLQNFFTP